ncbi:MAG: 4Fe-4S binding protein [Methanosphaera sp.]
MWEIISVEVYDYCDLCGCCIDYCPEGAIECCEPYYINPDICTLCGNCSDACPIGALVVHTVWVDDNEYQEDEE